MILRNVLVILLALGAGACLAPAGGAEGKRPNIVLILCDDMGWSDIGCYGGEVQTPNIDRLAAEGMRFTRFYNNAKCTTTRASVVTGLYPRRPEPHLRPDTLTVGELERFYSMADVVFVGGSLIPHGGHNMLEATRLGRPTCFGPHTENFVEEASILLDADAAIRVQNAAELEARLRELLEDPGRRADLGARARSETERLGGAAERHVAWVDAQLSLSLPAKN